MKLLTAMSLVCGSWFQVFFLDRRVLPVSRVVVRQMRPKMSSGKSAKLIKQHLK